MANGFTQLQQTLISVLGQMGATVAAARGPTAPLMASPAPSLHARLIQLVDAIEPLASSSAVTLHRSTLVNILALSTPVGTIQARGTHYSQNTKCVFSYSGPYQGYLQAFFPGLTAFAWSHDTRAVVPQSAGWWQQYQIALLTDAIRTSCPSLSGSINNGPLQAALTKFATELGPNLAATYANVLALAWPATQPIITQIAAGGEDHVTAGVKGLVTALGHPALIAEVNAAVAVPGDSAAQATWFLFSMWTLLAALQAAGSDKQPLPPQWPRIQQAVDFSIEAIARKGLRVPSEVAAGAWSSSYQASWFGAALSGADLAAISLANITAVMPETATLYLWPPTSGPDVCQTGLSDGYAQSFTHWSAYNGDYYAAPSHGSCFSGDTGVLMGDGSVRRIDAVRPGDEVATFEGKRKVEAVARPWRSGRRLYRIDGIAAAFTATHPFRLAAQPDKPARAALDPWRLADLAPTVAAEGVAELAPGMLLAGQERGAPQAIPVSKIVIDPAQASDDETRLYDLILVDWASQPGNYVVGGPERFVLAESEVPEVRGVPETALALLTAFKIFGPYAARNLPLTRAEFDREAEQLLTGMCSSDVLAALRRAAISRTREQVPVAFDTTPFTDGKETWDSRLGHLIEQAVLRVGREVRAAIGLGWRFIPEQTDPFSDRLSVTLHDLFLMNGARLAAGHGAELELSIAAQAEASERTLPIAPSTRDRYALWLDSVLPALPLEPAAMSDVHAVVRIVAALHLDGRKAALGQVVLPLSARRGYHRAELLLHDPHYRAIARLGLDLRRLHASQCAHEAIARAAWRDPDRLLLAQRFGNELGRLLAARHA